MSFSKQCPHVPAVVLAVVHRPSSIPSHLRQVRERRSALPVMIPRDADELRPGICYIGEPSAHLSLAERSRVRLVEGARDIYRNRTVDLIFASVAAHAGERAVGVVLSGALSDGSRGLAAMNLAGGVTMVVGSHLEASPGMPRNAMAYDGAIDFVGSPREIANEIFKRISGPGTEKGRSLVG